MSLPASGGRLAFWRAVGCVLDESGLPRGRVVLEVTSEGSGKRATGLLAAAGCARASCPWMRARGGRRAESRPGLCTPGCRRLAQVQGPAQVEVGDRRSGGGGCRRGPPASEAQLPPGVPREAGRPGGAVAVKGAGMGVSRPCPAQLCPAAGPEQLRTVPQAVFLVATIQQNARSFLKDLNFADELPYTGCLATKFKQG